MSLEQLLAGAVERGAAPGFVATVVGRDGVLDQASAGTLGPGDDRPLGPDTLFRLASLTKSMASVAALQLVERGELRLDRPVADFVPAFGELQVLEGFDGDEPRLRPPARQATITHLLTHTSGCGYMFTSAELLRWHELTGTPTIADGKLACLQAPLLHDPGERWTYGISTDWLGQVVEAVAGRPLEDQLREHVWAPLGMRDTTFFPTAEQRAALPALVLRLPDGGVEATELADAEPEFAAGGSGAYSTPNDYARFQRALLRGGELDGERVLRPETVDEMFTDHLAGAPLPGLMRSAVPELTNDVPRLPVEQGWGLGLHVVLEDIPGMRRAGTGDWAGLFNCYYWLDRTTGIGGALMTQLLPFFDGGVLETLVGFEAAVYASVGSSAAPA